ncbi:hypothetical protein [Stagnihabitans tardus]|uniref:Uncharacterized protein n=1 Tax=Stagnihabitans tardus TaxID=2699202 RepID=A0AAE4YDJ4_9RHOB|nr:hypothetical protein [Stagnihabitans tardus]NBZ87630.1 hypothetical protein [Stagnihabitans tardus]
MIDALVTFGGIVAAFSIFDLLLDSKGRGKLSEYIFGFHNVPKGSIEAFVARTICNALSNRNDEVSIVRVLIWSIAMAPLCAVLGDVIFTSDMLSFNISESAYAILVRNVLWNPSLFLSIFAIIAIVSLPFDYWNAIVAKRIYSEKSSSIGVWHLALNAIISGVPVAFFYFGLTGGWLYAWLLDHFLNASVSQTDGFVQLLVIHLFVYLPASIGSSVYLSFLVRISVTFFAIIIRFLLAITTLNRGIAMHSRAHDFPFTSVGVFFAVCYSIINLL